MAPVFPIALFLQHKAVLVVGAGPVAARRCSALIQAQASVHVVAPHACQEIDELHVQNRLHWSCKEFEPGDVVGCALVLTATSLPKVNKAVAAACRTEGILFSDSEEPERGDCIVPASLQRGPVTISVTTGGASPRLAATIRTQLESLIGPEYGSLAELLGELRRSPQAAALAAKRRGEALIAAADDPEILAMLRAGLADEARRKAFQWISR